MRLGAIAAAAALLLPSCGPKALVLPEAPVDRAATCGVVAAAEARAATADIRKPLDFDQQGRILHYALLAGVEGEDFSAETASAVTKRMGQLQEAITGGKWRQLAPECRAAYPEIDKTAAALPRDRLQAQLGCDELGKFLSDTLAGQDEYAAQLGDYGSLKRKFDQSLGPSLRARTGANLARQQAERRKALAKVVKLGSPAATMRQCVEQYG